MMNNIMPATVASESTPKVEDNRRIIPRSFPERSTPEIDIDLTMAFLSGDQRRTFDIDREVDSILQTEVIAGIVEAIEEKMDEEIQIEEDATRQSYGADEVDGGALCTGEEAPREEPAGDGVAYCQHVLRQEQCPYGRACRFRHLCGLPSGSPAKPTNDGALEEALTCAVCQEPFVSPVTLMCGHSFDRECLEQLRDASWIRAVGCPVGCPICRRPIVWPLPEVNYTLRELVKARFPHVLDAREADQRLRKRNRSMALPPECPSGDSLAAVTPQASLTVGKLARGIQRAGIPALVASLMLLIALVLALCGRMA